MNIGEAMKHIFYYGRLECAELVVQPTQSIDIDWVFMFLFIFISKGDGKKYSFHLKFTEKKVMKILKRKATGILLSLTLLFMVGIPGSAQTAYANDSPDLEIDIVGGTTEGGELVFENVDDTGWYPGLTGKGTVRINNLAFHKVKIRNLGLKMELSDEEKFNIFDDDMHLIIKKGTYPNFEDSSLYEGKFSEILFDQDSSEYRGKNVDIEIGRNGYIDLEYAVSMDEDASQDMQGITAKLSFLLNLNEVPQPIIKDDDRNKHKSKDDEVPFPAFLDDQHWAHDCIQALLAHGIIELEEGDTVRPDDYITRAETAMLVGRAIGLEPKDKLFSGYLDPLPKEARGYIIATSEAKIFRGYPGWLFRPNNNITREELTSVLVRAFNKKLEGDQLLFFKDNAQISWWALEDVKAGVQNQVIGGYPDNTFRPKNFMTRAEAFSIVCRLMGFHSQH